MAYMQISGGNEMDELSLQRENGKIYSHIRGKWLDETPEEFVRQTFVVDLVNNLFVLYETVMAKGNLSRKKPEVLQRRHLHYPKSKM